MRVSVVICTFAPEMYDHFVEAVESVLGQTYDDVELVLVVDGVPAIYDCVKEDFGNRQNITILMNPENMGLSASRNKALKYASGEIIAFMDDDAVAADDWISELVEAYDRHDALAVGGRMAPLWISEPPVYLPEEFYWLIGVTHKGFPEASGEVRNTFGSNISFRRDVLEDLGGFETDLGIHGDGALQGEETLLSIQLEESYGQRVWYNPDAVVSHKVFKYRTDVWWLLRRAFWQGYSKRLMEETGPANSGHERAFLKQLLTEFAPFRIANFVRNPSLREFEKLMMLLLLTATVGTGYCYRMAKFSYGRD